MGGGRKIMCFNRFLVRNARIIYIYMVSLFISWNFCNFWFDFKKNKTNQKFLLAFLALSGLLVWYFGNQIFLKNTIFTDLNKI